jgi:subtilisin family serine protease
MTKYHSRFLVITILTAIALWFVFTSQAQQPPVSEEVANNSVQKEEKQNIDTLPDKPVDENFDQQKFVAGEALVKLKNRTLIDSLVSTDNQKIRQQAILANAPELTQILEQFQVESVTPIFRTTSPLGGKAKRSAHRRHELSLTSWFKVRAEGLKNSTDETLNLIKELKKSSEIEVATPNYILKGNQLNPNDPFYSSSNSWGQGYRDLWGLQIINAPSAWNTTLGAGVTVAVIDSGLDFTHPDITENIWYNAGERGTDSQGRNKESNNVDDDNNGYIDDWRGFDFVTLDGTPVDNDPTDDYGHGTFIAGNIAAVANNIGVVGVAPQAKIMTVKGLNSLLSGTTEDLAVAVKYAADNGAQVINCSFGGRVSSEQFFLDAFAYAHDVKGAVIIAAAGNNNQDIGTEESGFVPANFRKVIAVSASRSDDGIANFSNFGAKIDVAAPGGDNQISNPEGTNPIFPNRSILSLLGVNSSANATAGGRVNLGDKYTRWSGTSFAAPYAAGVAALILSSHPEYSPEQVRQALRLGADDRGALGFDNRFGYGRVNAARSLTIQALETQLIRPYGVIGNDVLQIQGNVLGAGLVNWRVEVGATAQPTSWTLLGGGTAPVINGLLAQWNAQMLTDGEYTLRLTATNSQGLIFEDRSIVVIDSLVLTKPTRGYVRGTVSIEGRVTPANFANYTIKIKGDNVGWLANPALTLTNNGQQQILGGVIGTWDITGVATDNYTIYVVANLTNGSTVEERVRVIVDSTINSNFPLNLNEITSFDKSEQRLLLSDINRDGKQEILVASRSKVLVYNDQGEMLSGWPQRVDGTGSSGSIINGVLATGDLTGDGVPEVIATSGARIDEGGYRQVFVWDANGNILPGWPKRFIQTDTGSPSNAIYTTSTMIADINGDRRSELIVIDYDSVYVFNKDGVALSGWPVRVGGFYDGERKSAVGDLNGDGQKEIVIGWKFDGLSYRLHIYNSDGSQMPNWPRDVGQNLYSLILGNIDSDSDLEIIFTDTFYTNDINNYVEAFNYNGSVVSGWPRMETQSDVIFYPVDLAIGDIDGDGTSKVIATSINQEIVENNNLLTLGTFYAWRGSGTLLSGFPVKYRTYTPGPSGRAISTRFAAPILGDVDADGKADVITAVDESSTLNDGEVLRAPAALRAYKFDGALAAGFPKPTLGWESQNPFVDNSAPAVGDIDGDGFLELAWIDHEANLYVWDLPSRANAAAQQWAMWGHDAGRTNNAQTPLPSAIAPEKTVGDYDGDERTDVAVFRAATNNWYVERSQAGFIGVSWGAAGDKPVPGHFDADHKTDYAVFRPSNGTWYVLTSTGDYIFRQWGQSGDVPVAGDFTGDGRDDFTVFRPSDGTWYVLPSDGGQPMFRQFGQNGDVPLVAYFDGDNKADFTVFRNGNWYISNNATGIFTSIPFGQTGDVPVPADYDGDGRTDVAVYREGAWLYLASARNNAFRSVTFGQAGDIPVTGDYDGDGRADQTVFRQGNWFINGSNSGYQSILFGLPNDLPLSPRP